MNRFKQPFRRYNFNIVFWLIGINLIVFAVMELLGGRIKQEFTIRLSMIPLFITGYKWFWTFITYMFVHGGFNHIFFNMFGLFIFGRHVEDQMGSLEFLIYYLVTGALAGVLSFAVYYFTGNHLVALMGASGALFAVELAFAVYYPNAVIYLFGILPLRAPVMVLGYTALEIFFTLTGGRGNTAHLTHLAGFAFGWVYFLVRLRINPWRRLTGR